MGYHMMWQHHDRSDARQAKLTGVALLLVIVIALHQVVMASPLHAAIMPMAAGMTHPATGQAAHAPTSTTMVDAAAMSGHGCDGCCPAAISTCPTVEAAQVFRSAGFAVSMVVAVAALVTFAATRAVPCATDWRWPPNRRRALLQVFLC